MLVELKGIQKRFGGVTALRDGNLAVRAGEVHLLLGENGAGKSTMVKIIAGMIGRDAGSMMFQGRPVNFRRPMESAAVGIAMVHQESQLAPHLTVAENLFLGREPRKPLGWVNRRRMQDEAARLIERHGFPLQANWRVEKLSPAGKQLVEICRAIQHGSSLLIFDEPTAALSESETAEVFRIVRTLRERGMGVIYITHRLEELRAVGDRVTILRDGESVHTGDLAGLTTERIIHHMVGREVTAIYQREALPRGQARLTVEHLNRAPLLKDLSFTVHSGEIVGVAGLVGAGRTELCRALFGLDRIDSGRVLVDGKPASPDSPRAAVRDGIALIPEDRQKHGLAMGLSIGYNMSLASLDKHSRFGFLNRSSEDKAVAEFSSRLRLRADSPRQLAGRLSGGNQQKVVIAKWLLGDARIFLFDEPTRGIDVGAKVEVFELMDQLARAGAAILMVSSELSELLQVADRILVMRQGRITAELPGRTSQEEIMRYAALDAAAG